MPWCDANDLITQVVAMYSKNSVSDLGVAPALFSSALTTAKQDLLDALEMRGYTSDQVEYGDRLKEFHLNQAVYRFFQSPGVAVPMDRDALKSYERSETVGRKNYGWRVGGVIVWPGLGAAKEDAAGTIGYGQTAIPLPPLRMADW